MEEIVQSIRRIMRNAQDDQTPVRRPATSRRNKVIDLAEVRALPQQEESLRVLRLKIDKIQSDYKKRMEAHRQEVRHYHSQALDLNNLVEDYKSKVEALKTHLRSAQEMLEKLHATNQELRRQAEESQQQSFEMLQALKDEFDSIYHPDRAGGDQLARAVRREVYVEFGSVFEQFLQPEPRRAAR